MSAPYIPGMPTPFPATERRHNEGPDVTRSSSTYQVNPLDALQSRTQNSEDEKRLADEKRQRQEAMEAVQRQQAQDELQALERQQADRQAAIEKSQPTIDAWKTRLDKSRNDYEAQPFPALFADRDNAEKAMGGIGLALAAFGQAMGAHANVMSGGNGQTTNYVGQIIDQDIARQKDKIKGLSDRMVVSKAGLADATDARSLLMAEVDARGLVAAKKAAAMAKANLAGQGLSQAAIDQHQAYISANTKAQEYKERIAGQLAESVSKNFQADSITTRTTDPAAHATKPSGADVEAVNKLRDDIDKIDRTINQVEKAPKAWNEYRDNEESWARSEAAGKNYALSPLRSAAQVIGIADIAPEQGLKTSEGKTVHQGMSQVKTSLAKGYGGVITDGDRSAAASEMANLAMSDGEAVENLRRTRDRLSRGLDTYLTNRGVVLDRPAAEPPPAAPPPPSGNSLLNLTGGKVGGNAPHSKGPDLRLDPASLPAPSLPPGPPNETPGNSPDNLNSEAQLPEDPNAPSIEDFQGASPGRAAARPVARPAAPVSAAPPPARPAPPPTMLARHTPEVQRVIDFMVRNPSLRDPTLMKKFGITNEDLQ